MGGAPVNGWLGCNSTEKIIVTNVKVDIVGIESSRCRKFELTAANFLHLCSFTVTGGPKQIKSAECNNYRL